MGFLGEIGEGVENIWGGFTDTLKGEGTPVSPAYKPNEASFSDQPDQRKYLQYLQSQAYGLTGPSASEKMIQQQTQKSNEQMAGTMGSTRGVQNPALLAKQAAMINAGQTQQAAAQGSVIRAQEQQGAQQEYADALARKQQNLMNLETMKANIASAQQQAEFTSAEGGKQRQSQLIGGLASGATMAAAASDIRVKENIQPANAQAKDYLDFQYRKMLDQVDPYTYDYKNDKYGKGKQLGVMAQDLEKSPLGKGMVDTKDGKKQINANISTILAGQAVLNDRLNKIEGEKMKGDYLDSYEAPGYVEDPNRQKFTLDEMYMTGNLPSNMERQSPVGEMNRSDSVYEGGRPRNMGYEYEGYRPINTNEYPALENPPVKINAEPMQVTGNLPAAPTAQPMSTSAIDAKAGSAASEKEKRDKARYLMEVYDRTNKAFSPSTIGPAAGYRPQRMENFEQYRPTRRR
jgi:hypothetical protein